MPDLHKGDFLRVRCNDWVLINRLLLNKKSTLYRENLPSKMASNVRFLNAETPLRQKKY